MAKFDLENLSRSTDRIMKGTAAMVAAAAFMVAAIFTPAAQPAKMADPSITNPAPVVMTIEEVDEAIVEEEPAEEEEKAKKLGLFARLKLAIFGFFSACAAWVAHKIPWGKIFCRRNLYILLTLVCLGLAAYYLLPLVWEDCPF